MTTWDWALWGWVGVAILTVILAVTQILRSREKDWIRDASPEKERE